jgi:3-deoxy-D-manno-octulosonic acid kinase
MADSRRMQTEAGGVVNDADIERYELRPDRSSLGLSKPVSMWVRELACIVYSVVRTSNYCQPGMSSTHEHFLSVSRGGILYDAARLRKPDPGMFTRDYWRSRGLLEEFAGGRGAVSLLHAEEGDWVLRHYRRGGFAARVSNDRYLWTGANATRSFREWRLLSDLLQRGLPVPAPIAAYFERRGATYRADIITARLPSSRTLAQVIEAESLGVLEWRRIGQTIARFHAAGVHHADLNANNIMLAGGEIYLLDFDRGRIRARGRWEADVVARLKRSLDKVKAQKPHAHFTQDDWSSLLAGLSG